MPRTARRPGSASGPKPARVDPDNPVLPESAVKTLLAVVEARGEPWLRNSTLSEMYDAFPSTALALWAFRWLGQGRDQDARVTLPGEKLEAVVRALGVTPAELKARKMRRIRKAGAQARLAARDDASRRWREAEAHVARRHAEEDAILARAGIPACLMPLDEAVLVLTGLPLGA